jgi:hypothetical protein
VPYVYQEFPKVKYHPDRDPVTVQDAIEEDALGPNWFDRPDQALEAKHQLAAGLKKLTEQLK